MEHDPPRTTYTIAPDYMRKAIEWYLDPVAERLGEIATGYGSAHDEASAGHASMGGGWCGGDGSGHVTTAAGSFLNEVVWQLGRLSAEQEEMASSLRDYAAALRKHIEWAERTDADTAESFHSISRAMGGGR